jgi:hypothetical protein
MKYVEYKKQNIRFLDLSNRSTVIHPICSQIQANA